MTSKRLITESDVRAMTRGAELVLGGDVIVTPAALDLAFERGLRVVHREPSGGAPGSCGCGGPGACAWAKILARDGTYVVVVAGGQPQIARMTEGGPVSFP